MIEATLEPDIASAFHCHGKRRELTGGEGNSVRVGHCVLKPIDNPERYAWGCGLLLKLSRKGFRISEPCRAIDGSFVYQGWAASIFEPGEHINGRWPEKLHLTRLFHSEINALDHSPMPPSTDRWSLAHEIAWQLAPLPSTLLSELAGIIEPFFARYRPLSRAQTIVHSDICGNILFQDGLDPCIIDFSPAYGSVEYTEAIMVADAIAWENAPLEIVYLLTPAEQYRQYLLRAICFRLVVAALFRPENLEWFLTEYTEFRPIIDFVL
jgi:uncharacterized protein (TIGR02569 family)